MSSSRPGHQSSDAVKVGAQITPGPLRVREIGTGEETAFWANGWGKYILKPIQCLDKRSTADKQHRWLSVYTRMELS